MRVGCGCLLYILLVFPLLLVLIILAGVNRWVLDRDFYQELLSEPDFYEEALNEAVINWSSADLPDEFGGLPPDALNAGLRAVITPEYLQAAAADTVDQMFDVLEGSARSFNFVFDLTPIKEALEGEGAADFASAYVGELPACDAEEEPLPADAGLPSCRPLDVSEGELVGQVTEALPQVAERLPDELTVSRDVRLPEISGIALQPGSVRTLMTTGLVILGIVAVLLWLMDAFIGATDVRSRFLWLGLTLLIPAGLVLLIGLGVNSLTLEGVIRDSILRGPGVQNAQFATSVAATAINASEQVRTGFLIAGGIPTLVAVVLLIVGLTVRPTDRPRNNGRYVQVPAR
jgi:hypothetical protein